MWLLNTATSSYPVGVLKRCGLSWPHLLREWVVWGLTLESCWPVGAGSLHCLLYHCPLVSCREHCLPHSASASLALVPSPLVVCWSLRRERGKEEEGQRNMGRGGGGENVIDSPKYRSNYLLLQMSLAAILALSAQYEVAVLGCCGDSF